MASTAAGGDAARGGLNPPHPNPSGDGGPKLRSPPGKGNKPVALAEITNTGKPNTARSIAVPDLVKENNKLITLLNDKTKIIDLSRAEIYKLRLALQASKQQNLQLAQSNSQMVAEINAGRDRMKILQHELACATALIKVKDSELGRNKNTANRQRKGIKSQVLKNTASTVTGVDLVTSGVEHHLAESQSAVSSNTVCQEPPQDGKQNRMLQRRKSSRFNPCEIPGISQNTLLADTVAPLAPSTFSVQKQYGQTTGKHIEKSLHEVVMASGFNEAEINQQPQETTLKEIQEECSREAGVQSHKIGDNAFNSKGSHLTGSQFTVSSNTVCQEPPQDGKQKRRLPRRRSSRLNQGSSEIGRVSQDTLHEDTVEPLAPSTLSVQKQYGQTTGKHMETEINQQQQEKNLKEIQEECYREAGVQSHKIGDKAFNSKQHHLTGSESSLPFNTVDPPEPPADNTMNRCSKKRSAIEDVNAKLDTTTCEPLRHEEKRKSQRRKSTRLNSVSSEDTDITVETEHKDVIAPLAGSSSNASRTNQKQNGDCSSRKSNEEQISGRRSLRRAAEKVVSYKEIPLNVKMRRP